MKLQIKRVYDAPAPGDGTRILVDRLWPRGLKRDAAEIDLWLKEIAPSAELRRWFGHDPQRWAEFRRRYFQELDGKAEAVTLLRCRLASAPVTLLYAATDSRHNNARALLEYIDR